MSPGGSTLLFTGTLFRQYRCGDNGQQLCHHRDYLAYRDIRRSASHAHRNRLNVFHHKPFRIHLACPEAFKDCRSITLRGISVNARLNLSIEQRPYVSRHKQGTCIRLAPGENHERFLIQSLERRESSLNRAGSFLVVCFLRDKRCSDDGHHLGDHGQYLAQGKLRVSGVNRDGFDMRHVYSYAAFGRADPG